MSGLLDLLQIADSSFPSGSYAHSLGLEALYAAGDVDLAAHLQFLLSNSLARVELPMLREAYLAEDRVRELLDLDRLMDVLIPVKEYRLASRSIGRSFLRAAAKIRSSETTAEHHPIVFGAVLHDWDLQLDDGLEVYAFQAMRQQLSAAQRLGKIGQSAVQDLLDRLKPAVRSAAARSWSLARDHIGGFAPLLHLAGMAHAQQDARLFLS